MLGKLKQFIRRVTPPPMQRTRAYPAISYFARSSFEEASREAGLGYLSPEIASDEPDYSVDLSSITMPPYIAALYCAIAIVAHEQLEHPIRVLDFGGAFGELSGYVKAAFPGIRLKWSVVETKLYVDRAIERQVIEPSFSYSIDDAGGPFDLALFSGTLQYVDDWRAPLLHPTIRSTERILVMRTSLGEQEIPFLQKVETERCTIQYPGRIIRAADLASTIDATHARAMSWEFDHHMGELGIFSAPAILWRRRR